MKKVLCFLFLASILAVMPGCGKNPMAVETPKAAPAAAAVLSWSDWLVQYMGTSVAGLAALEAIAPGTTAQYQALYNIFKGNLTQVTVTTTSSSGSCTSGGSGGSVSIVGSSTNSTVGNLQNSTVSINLNSTVGRN